MSDICTCSPYFGCSEYAPDCPRHANPLVEPKHLPNEDGSCSLLCTCRTPLTREEIDTLHDLGLF